MPPSKDKLDVEFMQRALTLAARGEGSVEPNPLVGCVIVKDYQVVGEGWHQRFGAAHAEVDALRAAGKAARCATMYVTLEPCCHHGKTPPCTDAILEAGVVRVVVAQEDPFPQVAGQGIRQLQEAGVKVELGVCGEAARELNAPYRKLTAQQRPWVIAKWAMTLDGKLASHTGDSRWISNEASRAVVHRLRGRVDAIVVGRQTAFQDDPLLTARPSGPRTATRVVLDTQASISHQSKLVLSASRVPTLIVTGPQVSTALQERLLDFGCELLSLESSTESERLRELLDELGRRKMTNVLIEGGGGVLGTALDGGEVDEVHVFVAPKLLGGAAATSVGGQGRERIELADLVDQPQVESLDGDVYIRGRVRRAE